MDILTISGRKGDLIIISGNGMNYIDKVFFNDVPSSFKTLSEQYLYATVPEGTSFGKVRAESSFLGATGYSDSDFIPLPEIYSFSPSAGLFFDSINILGSSFSGVTGVEFGDFDCSFSVSGNDSIFFQVPSGSSKGKIKLLTYSGLEVFSYQDFDPTVVITGFEYDQAFPGLPIVIKGKYFDEHLLHGFKESIEYDISLINRGEGLNYHSSFQGGYPVANFSRDLLKGSTYIFNFSGIQSGDHFYLTQNAKVSGEAFDMSSLGSGASGFGSVIQRDAYLYLLPEKFGKVVKLNSSGLFDSGKFEVLDLNSNYSGLSGFKGGFQYNNSGFLIPTSDGRMVRFGLGSQFGTGAVEILDLSSLSSGLSGFNGGFSQFNYGYLAPYVHGKFARVDLDLFKTGESGVTGIKFIDLTLIDPELTGFAGAFEALGKAILVPNRHSKLVSIELGYFNSPELFTSSGVQVFDLDRDNFCDLIITGFFYTQNNFIDMNGSGLGHPSGINTGFIEQNISGQFYNYLLGGYCGGPSEYTTNEYVEGESTHVSYVNKVDLITYSLIVSGSTSGEANTNFGVYYSGGFSGDQTLVSGNLYFAANSAKILSKSIYFESGLDTGIRLFASGWVASGVLKEVYEIPYCVLITSGNSETGSLQAFNDRFESGYCGTYLATGFDRIYTGVCHLYVSGTGIQQVSDLFSGYFSSGACSEDGFNFTYGNYLSGSGSGIIVSYEIITQTGAYSGYAYSGLVSELSGIFFRDGFSRNRLDSSFYDVVNIQTILVSGLITGSFDLIVTGSTQSGADFTFDSYYASGLSLDYRLTSLDDFVSKYNPSGADVARVSLLVNATGESEVLAYQFSGTGYIASGSIIGKIYPYLFETGWITSGMVTRGEDFYHRISGHIRKSVGDNLENFIGGFAFNRSGYLLPGATGSGYAQIFAFNVENFDDNINIDLTGDFSGNYDGGFQDVDNGYFVSRTSSKIFKFENEYFDYNNLSSFDTQSVFGPFTTCDLFLTGITSGVVEDLYQSYFSSGYCGSGFYSTGQYLTGNVNVSKIFSNFIESGRICTGIGSLVYKSSGAIEATDMFYSGVVTGALGNPIDGYTYDHYGSGEPLCSGSERFLNHFFLESGGSGDFVASGEITSLSGYVITHSGVELKVTIYNKYQILGLSAGAILGEYTYGIPYENGTVVRYRNTYEPYTRGYTVSGDGVQLKVIFKPEEELSGLIYFASGNTEYNDSGSFNVVKSNQFLVQFFGSEGDEFFERLDEYSLSGIIPAGALSGDILITRPDDGDGILKYY